MSMTRRVMASLFMATLALVLVARAENPANTKADPAKKTDDIDVKTPKSEAALEQDRLAREFREFKNALLTLKDRLASSDRQEDKDKAIILEKALVKASE